MGCPTANLKNLNKPGRNRLVCYCSTVSTGTEGGTLTKKHRLLRGRKPVAQVRHEIREEVVSSTDSGALKIV
uniref:Riboflavin kinase n=1 Tax=Steinernema glaseri TaxID=37863 RepID=A0A1I7YXB2_9BILA